MHAADPEHPSWRDYRRRRNTLFGAILCWIALIPLVAIVSDQSLFGRFWWLLALPIFVWFMIANFRIVWWRCPRCDNPFFTKGIWYGNVFAGTCYHCGLRKWADPSSEARGA